MKEVLFSLRLSTPSIETPPLSKIKVQEKNYLSLVSRSSIFWLLMLREERSDSSEEPV